MDENKSKLKEIISSVFIIDIANISEDNQNKNWDSLKHMNLILALEDEFDLKFKNSEIIQMDNFVSILQICVILLLSFRFQLSGYPRVLSIVRVSE